MITRPTYIKLFEQKIHRTPNCWHWTGAIDHDGYGRFRTADKSTYAHRIAYEAYVGEIGKDMQIDHLCFNRSCVNPKHLEQVTMLENIQRRTDWQRQKKMHPRSKKKVTCKRGHLMTQENTFFIFGVSTCRTCYSQINLSNNFIQ